MLLELQDPVPRAELMLCGILFRILYSYWLYGNSAPVGKDIWKLGKIIDIPSKNKVVIQYPGNVESGNLNLPNMKQIIRSPRNVSIISAIDDLGLNSRDYFNKLKKEN